MDPVRNPYAPGAGQRPPELAGRDAELQGFEVVLERVARSRPERSMVLIGLRGVGKTVLLNAMRSAAVRRGWGTGKLEARPGAVAAPPARRSTAPGGPRAGPPAGCRRAPGARGGEGVRAARAGRREAEQAAVVAGHRRSCRHRSRRLGRHRDRHGRAVQRCRRPRRRHRPRHRGLHRRDAGHRARRRVGAVRGLPRDLAAGAAAGRRRRRAAARAGRAVGGQVLLRAAVPLRPHRPARTRRRRHGAAGARA